MSDREPATRAAEIEIVPLSPAIGAEIIGIDLAQPLDDAVFAGIRDAWHRNGILLFRNQSLDEEEQVAFAARFGALSGLVNRHNGKGRNPAIMFISNIRQDGQLIGALPDGEMYFHSDQCYLPRPCMATMLYSIEVPRHGGNTLFANAYKAYETLPEATRRRLHGLRAMNVYDYDTNPTLRGAVIRDGVPHCEHPVVRTHPATGRKALYVNRLMTDHIVGMPRDESDALLNELFAHQEEPRFVYEHVWRPGELILWDNRCTLHARSDFDASERRLMRRVAVLGEVPV